MNGESSGADGHRLDRENLPPDFPTHFLDSSFYEELGRAVATFSFLEEVLLKAVFAVSATTEYPDDELPTAYAKWAKMLERSISDPLGGLIDTFAKTLKNNPKITLDNPEVLVSDLRSASQYRNVLCHGSWKLPDQNGASIPFFVNRQNLVFSTPIDIDFLKRTRAHVSDLICSVFDTVTYMGFQFPSTNGPGEVIWKKD